MDPTVRHKIHYVFLLSLQCCAEGTKRRICLISYTSHTNTPSGDSNALNSAYINCKRYISHAHPYTQHTHTTNNGQYITVRIRERDHFVRAHRSCLFLVFDSTLFFSFLFSFLPPFFRRRWKKMNCEAFVYCFVYWTLATHRMVDREGSFKPAMVNGLYLCRMDGYWIFMVRNAYAPAHGTSSASRARRMRCEWPNSFG